ncbi:retrotransposon protein, putative, ty1-copia subclass [Tanacetum coccineum]
MVGCKWIFKKKTGMDGKVHTYKGRLVAKGYTQTHRIDYEETFSPVAKLKSIRIMLAIAWMCKLQKDIYGLKQASRSWNLCFYEKVTQFGFSRSEVESCLCVKVSGSVVVFLVLYMDYILLIGNDISTLQSVKGWLGKCFAMKDLGDATYIIGIKIYRDRSKRLIGLSQDTYLDKNLKRFKMENSKKGNLPLHHGIKISKDLCPKTDEELDRMSRVPYALAVGLIMYAMTCTRPDVSFALSMVSRHQYNPGEGHWTSVNLADSTCESEYIAACEASKEAIWMKNFIGDLGFVPTVQDPIEIFLEEGHVIMKHMRSEDNPADPLTKELAKSRHDEHARYELLEKKIDKDGKRTRKARKMVQLEEVTELATSSVTEFADTNWQLLQKSNSQNRISNF